MTKEPIAQAEEDLKIAEQEWGADSLEVAERLEYLAKLLRTSGLRLLDAANMVARAEVIRRNFDNEIPRSRSAVSRDQQTIIPEAGSKGGAKALTVQERVPCPICCELIVEGAKKCRFCGESLQVASVEFEPEEIDYEADALELHYSQYKSEPKGKFWIVVGLICGLFVLTGLIFGFKVAISLVTLTIFGNLFIVLYFLPSFIAFNAKRKNAGAILVLNLLLGWTFIGWVVSLIWACIRD